MESEREKCYVNVNCITLMHYLFKIVTFIIKTEHYH